MVRIATQESKALFAKGLVSRSGNSQKAVSGTAQYISILLHIT